MMKTETNIYPVNRFDSRTKLPRNDVGESRCRLVLSSRLSMFGMHPPSVSFVEDDRSLEPRLSSSRSRAHCMTLDPTLLGNPALRNVGPFSASFGRLRVIHWHENPVPLSTDATKCVDKSLPGHVADQLPRHICSVMFRP